MYTQTFSFTIPCTFAFQYPISYDLTPDQDGIAFLMTGIICRILTATAEIRKIAIVPKIRYLMLVIGNI
jgi:ABC-type uncharacterized transport system permease subunit